MFRVVGVYISLCKCVQSVISLLPPSPYKCFTNMCQQQTQQIPRPGAAAIRVLLRTIRKTKAKMEQMTLISTTPTQMLATNYITETTARSLFFGLVPMPFGGFFYDFVYSIVRVFFVVHWFRYKVQKPKKIIRTRQR